MSITEIVLIIVGAIVLALGYLLPARKRDTEEDIQLIGEDEVRKLVSKEVEGTKEHILDIVDETVTYTMEKTERSMERVANEKIMAINEYSDTVLDEINKNHKEVIFLYDMLNDKHENLKLTVSEASRTAEEIKQTVKDVEITVREAGMSVREAGMSAREAEMSVREAEVFVREAGMSAREVEVPFREVEMSAREAEIPFREIQDEVSDFVPINPPIVKVIHGPESDYVAGEPQEETYDVEREAFSREQDVSVSQELALKMEDESVVDIQFTGVKEGNRNSNERILELHKAGKSNMAIAKELGLGIGEVKLVIDLFEGL